LEFRSGPDCSIEKSADWKNRVLFARRILAAGEAVSDKADALFEGPENKPDMLENRQSNKLLLLSARKIGEIFEVKLFHKIEFYLY
jgi:hypothetical protein